MWHVKPLVGYFKDKKDSVKIPSSNAESAQKIELEKLHFFNDIEGVKFGRKYRLFKAIL